MTAEITLVLFAAAFLLMNMGQLPATLNGSD